MAKKLSALLIAFVLLLTISCSGDGSALIPFLNNDGSTLDCEGKTFSFASPWYSEWYAFSDDTLPTAEVEAMMNRFHSIKEEFNANFEMLQMQVEDITQLLVTGQDFPEMLDITGATAYELYKSNTIISLNQIETVDFNDLKWGEQNFIQYGKFDDEQYGFYPWHWEFIPQFAGAVIFNSEMIASFGGIHPYEMQENGIWDWKNFENELRKYSITENEIQYYGAIAGDLSQTAKAAIMSNGAQIIEGDSQSGYEFGMTSSESLEALEWVKSIYTQNLITNEVFSEFSINNLAPFWIGESYYGTVFNPNDSGNATFAPSALADYGFIQFPTGPKGSSENVGSYVYYNRRLNYISQISDIEPKNIGTIINYIFEPIDGIEVGWKELAQNMIFTENNNQKCIENFIYIIENLDYDYSLQMGESISDKLDDALESIVRGTRSTAEALGNVESAVMAEITKSE